MLSVMRINGFMLLSPMALDRSGPHYLGTAFS